LNQITSILPLIRSALEWHRIRHHISTHPFPREAALYSYWLFGDTSLTAISSSIVDLVSLVLIQKTLNWNQFSYHFGILFITFLSIQSLSGNNRFVCLGMDEILCHWNQTLFWLYSLIDFFEHFFYHCFCGYDPYLCFDFYSVFCSGSASRRRSLFLLLLLSFDSGLRVLLLLYLLFLSSSLLYSFDLYFFFSFCLTSTPILSLYRSGVRDGPGRLTSGLLVLYLPLWWYFHIS